jgi:DNA adenine methylase
MRYLGGKSRVAKHICEVMLQESPGRTLYVEPFLGSANIAAIMVPHFGESTLSDACEDLVLLWQAALGGWVPPVAITEERYAVLRNGQPSAERAFAGFGCSFGGKWFGGYARSPHRTEDIVGASSRSVARKATLMRGGNPTVIHGGYAEVLASIDLPEGTVIYCDPPYAGTTGYAAVGAFDSVAFWRRMAAVAETGADVYVSESEAPAGWLTVWEATPQESLGRHSTARRVERLYRKA